MPQNGSSARKMKHAWGQIDHTCHDQVLNKTYDLMLLFTLHTCPLS